MNTERAPLHDLRTLLADHGAAPPPWSPPRAAVDALLGLLRAHRDDDAFWATLQNLAERVPVVPPASDALAPHDRTRLLAALRDELSAGRGAEASTGSEASAAAWIRGRRSAPALAAFWLLAVASGCGAPCDEAADEGLRGADAGVYCELVALVDGADVGEGTKNQMLSCLPGLDEDRRAALLEAWEELSEEDLAAAITQVAYSADDCDYEDAH